MAELYNTSLLNDANLEAYYRFEDNGNDSHGSLNPVASDVPTFVSGKYSKAATFSQAADNYYGYGNVLNIVSGDVSMAVWFKSAAADANNYICTRRHTVAAPDYDGIFFMVAGGNGGIGLLWRDDTGDVGTLQQYTATNATSIYDDKWHHLAWTMTLGTDSSTKAYVDGKLITGSWTNSGDRLPANNADQKWVIGGSYIGAAYAGNLDGSIDDLAIFDRILTPAEIKTLASDATASFLLNLI